MGGLRFVVNNARFLILPDVRVPNLASKVRGHWGIETRLHWVRNVVYDEDRSQVRTENGPRVMATLRNTAISLLRHVGVPHIQRAVNYLHRHPHQVARILFP